MKDLHNLRFEVEAERVNPDIPAWLTITFSQDRKPTASIEAKTHDGLYTISSESLHHKGGSAFMPGGGMRMEGNHLSFTGQVKRDGWEMVPDQVCIRQMVNERSPYVAYAVSGMHDIIFDQIDTPYGIMKLYNESHRESSVCWIIIEPITNSINDCKLYIDRFYKMCAFGWKRPVQAVHQVICDGSSLEVISEPLWNDSSNVRYGMCEIYGRDEVFHAFAKAATNPHLSQIIQRASMWYTAGSSFLNSIAMEAFVSLEYLTYAFHDLYLWCRPFERRMERMCKALRIQTSDLSTSSNPFKSIANARNDLAHRGNPDDLSNDEFIALIHDAHRIIERLVLAAANQHKDTTFTPKAHHVAQ